MEDPAQAVAYARADFTEANQLFTDLVERQAGTDLDGRLLDLGCGSGAIALAMAKRSPAATVWAVDTNERARALLFGQDSDAVYEAARALETSFQAVGQRLSRARTQIRQCVALHSEVVTQESSNV